MRWQETDLLDEGVHLFVGSTARSGHPLDVLSPGDEHSKPCRFDKLAELAGFGCAEFRDRETCAGEVLGGSLGGFLIKTTDEFLIVEHVLHHLRVLTPDRAVDDGRADAFLHLSSGAHRQRAVNDGKGGLVLFDVGSRGADKIRKLERIADMQHRAGAIDLDWRNVHTLTFVRTTQNLEQGVPDFPQACHNYDFIRQSLVYRPFMNLALACLRSVCL